MWGYDGTVPGPTLEAERGRRVTVDWVNELEGPLPLAVTIAPSATDADGVPVQCHPGLSGGSLDEGVAALSGHAVVHLHGGLTPPATTAGPRTCSLRARPPSSTIRWTSARRSSGTTTT